MKLSKESVETNMMKTLIKGGEWYHVSSLQCHKMITSEILTITYMTTTNIWVALLLQKDPCGNSRLVISKQNWLLLMES
jgi:hypothetical protein